MPCYNSGKFIKNAISSVQAQTVSNWELLVCDDGSDDESVSIIMDISKQDNRIKLMHNKSIKGASGARNTALDIAKGRYIAFLDADDLWLPKKLEKQLNFLQKQDLAFVFGYCYNIKENGEIISLIKAPNFVSLNKLHLSNFIPCLTVIYDTKYLGKVKQPIIKKRNDFALWLKILFSNKEIKATCLPEVVASYRVNSYGLSAKKIDSLKYYYSCLRVYAENSVIKAVACTIIAVFFKILKSKSVRLYNYLVTNII